MIGQGQLQRSKGLLWSVSSFNLIGNNPSERWLNFEHKIHVGHINGQEMGQRCRKRWTVQFKYSIVSLKLHDSNTNYPEWWTSIFSLQYQYIVTHDSEENNECRLCDKAVFFLPYPPQESNTEDTKTGAKRDNNVTAFEWQVKLWWLSFQESPKAQ